MLQPRLLGRVSTVGVLISIEAGAGYEKGGTESKREKQIDCEKQNKWLRLTLLSVISRKSNVLQKEQNR